MLRRKTPLKFKLAFFATLLVFFVAFTMSTTIRRGQKKAIIESKEESLKEVVRGLNQAVRQALYVSDETDVVNYINMLKRFPETAYAMVIKENGIVMAHSDPLMIGKILDDPPTKQTLLERHRPMPLIQYLNRENRRAVIDISIPIFMDNKSSDYRGVSRIGFDKTVIDQDISRSFQDVDRQIFRAFLWSLLLGLLGALLLATFITKPLSVLKQGAERIGEGQLDYRIKVTTKDELQDLAEEFNLMGQKLGELDRMKQDFVSNVTHELRSPLTSIRGYIELLLQEAAGSLTALQHDYLSIIKNSAVRLGRFIDNLLDVAKIEAHKLKLTPEVQDLYQLVHEMELLFKPQLDEKHITLINKIPPQGMLSFVDKDKMAEVFINLTSNAIKFTPENGMIIISAMDNPQSIQIGIEDNGVGIPPAMINNLFNKFEQVKSTPGHARQHKGTGLGLTIAKGIVDAHGGKIWIKSPASNGKGTIFYFTVPKLTDDLKARIQG